MTAGPPGGRLLGMPRKLKHEWSAPEDLIGPGNPKWSYGNKARCTAKAKQRGGRCGQPAVSGRRTCKYHGGTVSARCKHGLFSQALARLRPALEQALADPTLFDLTEPVAMLKVAAIKAAQRADKNDTPDFRVDVLAACNRDDWDKVRELCEQGAEEDLAYDAMSTAMERLARRIEESWKIKLQKSQAINARDLAVFLRAILHIVTTETQGSEDQRSAGGRINDRLSLLMSDHGVAGS